MADGLGRVDVAGPADEMFQVFAFDVLHRDVKGQAGFAQVVKPADMAVGNLAGVSQLVLEPLDGLFVEADLGLDELKGHDLLDLLIEAL